MVPALAEMLHIGQGLLAAAFLVFVRIGAVVALMPGLGEQSVPLRVRLGVALALTALVLPLVREPVTHALPRGTIAPVQLAAEVVSGLAIGAFFRALVWALQIAGTIAGQATSLAQIFGSAGGAEPMPAFGGALVAGALALAMAAGLHVRVVIALAGTYDLLPPGRLADPALLADSGVRWIAGAFGTGFGLALPFLVASVIYNVALGIINRAMPQLMVALVGAPAISLAALALMAVCAPVILQLWRDGLDLALSVPLGPGAWTGP